MNDILEVAISEIKVFDRPSANTSNLLIDEILKLRSLLDMQNKPDVEKLNGDDEFTTVNDLIEILQAIKEPRNTLIIVESNNRWHDVTGVVKRNINYRKCICLSNSGTGVSRPSETLEKMM